MRRIIVGTLFVILIVTVAIVWWLMRPLPILTVTTWAGAYGRAQAAALMRPYAQGDRIDVRLAQYDGGLGPLRHAVRTHDYRGDVIDFELPDAIAACDEGLLEKMDLSALPPGADGTPAARDFVAGALGPCWVGSVVYAQVIAYDAGKFAGGPPASLADFFDLKKFPGGRGLRRSSAKYNLEMALLADGVPPADIYKVLAADAGVSRALAKLDTIGPAIQWWSAGSEPAALIESGQCVFTTILNGDVYDAAIHRRALGVIWDRELYELDVFGVPKADPRRDRAMDFVRYATGSAALARVAGWVPYGPARKSAQSLVGKNPELGIAMAPFLPTAQGHFASAFAIDDGWWRDHGAAIEQRWQAWLAQTRAR